MEHNKLLQVVDTLGVDLQFHNDLGTITGSKRYKVSGYPGLTYKLQVIESYHTDNDLLLLFEVTEDLRLLFVYDGFTMVVLLLDVQEDTIPLMAKNRTIKTLFAHYRKQAVKAFTKTTHEGKWESIGLKDISCW